MAMPARPPAHVVEPRRYTVEEVYAWPNDGNRYEVVHGELLVTPMPRALHQWIVVEFLLVLHAYLEPIGLRDTLSLPGDIMWGDDVWVQPDLFVVVPEQVSASWKTFKHLRLVIEVLSPASARGDRVVKRAAYQENGVETYWIVDADKRLVEVWHPDDEVAEIVAGELRWRVMPDAPELAIGLPELFGRMPR